MILRPFEQEPGKTYLDIAKQYYNDLKRGLHSRLSYDFKDENDLTSARFAKRVKASLNALPELEERFSDVAEMDVLKKFFLTSNTIALNGGYNRFIDEENLTTMPAAIWILDQLVLQNRLDALYEYLPWQEMQKNAKADLLLSIPFHPMYDASLISALVYLIRHRNTAKVLPDMAYGSLVWDKDTPDQDEASQKLRQAFDAVIALLDPDVVQAACKRYEEKVWAYYRVIFSIAIRISNRVQELDKILDDLEAKIDEQLEMTKVPKPSILLTKQAVENPLDFLARNEKRLEPLRKQVKVYEDEQDAIDPISLSSFCEPENREYLIDRLNGLIPDEVADAYIHFRVDDPFESAFALLYLLDSGSEVPWLYFGSVSVAYTMLDLLPFDAFTHTGDTAKSLAEWNDTLYTQRYRGFRWPGDVNFWGEDAERKFGKNLSQILYANTGTVFPRVIPGAAELEDYFADLGELSPKEKDAYALLFYSLQTAKSRGMERAQAEAFYDELDVDKDDDSVESTQEGNVASDHSSDSEQDASPLEADLAHLSAENERLRKKNAKLVDILQSMQGDKKELERTMQGLLTESDKQHQELADLRERVYYLDNREEQEEPEDASIQFPYEVKKKIVSFGGHISWLQEMRKLLPNVIFIGPESLPNMDMIRRADAIWLQVNCLSHSNYYKILAAAKNLGKQVRYYVYAGHRKSAEQIVKSVES